MTSQRRRWLATAGVALTAGAGGWLWQRQRLPAAADEAITALWALEFETPAGSKLRMQSLRGKPLVINFWATWCPPCVREMPTLDRFYREHAGHGWQVLGIAADNAAAVREFVARTPVTFALALAGFEGVALSRTLGNGSGGLPFTVVFSGDGQVLQRHMGETTHEQLAAWAKGIS